MIVQIYEVTTCAEARALGMMGVDHVGVLVGEGSFPREQTIEKAREIFAAIPAGSKASALSLTHDRGSYRAAHRRVNARLPASRGSATASFPIAIANTQGGVSESLTDAEYSSN